jgi:F420-0:gamma-glutamyl ligase-like protein
MVLESNTRHSNKFDVIVVFEEALFVAEGHVISEPGRKPSTESVLLGNTVKMNLEV